MLLTPPVFELLVSTVGWFTIGWGLFPIPVLRLLDVLDVIVVDFCSLGSSTTGLFTALVLASLPLEVDLGCDLRFLLEDFLFFAYFWVRF